jgi:cell division protease FtsH
MKLALFATLLPPLFALQTPRVMLCGSRPPTHVRASEWTYTELIENLNADHVERLVVPYQSSIATIVDTDGGKHTTTLPVVTDKLLDGFVGHGVDVQLMSAPIQSSVGAVLGTILNILPFFLILFGPLIFRLISQRGGDGGAGGAFPSMMQMGQMGNAPPAAVSTNTTFTDIAGYEETKLELTEVVDILKSDASDQTNPYNVIGARVPRGIILEGPPGTGKTLLAKAVAGEAGVPFFSASGSEFVQMFVGLGASRVRQLFAAARKNGPAIVFIDEIDAIGRQREASGGMRGGNDEREQTLNQLLTEMDGFTSKDSVPVIVIAATNRADILDSALTRAGRFDRKVTVPAPNANSRRKIIDLELAKKPTEHIADEEVAVLTDMTRGLSGADINSMVNEAAILGARQRAPAISMSLLTDALEKQQIGIQVGVDERRDETRALVAIHEAGHAVVGRYMPDHPNATKITIAATTSGAGGYTVFGQGDDDGMPRRSDLVQRLAVMFGGRAAEEIVYGKDRVSVGASNDMARASALARDAVTRFGFGSKFTIREPTAPYGSESAWKMTQIDKDADTILTEAYACALDTVATHVNETRYVAAVLYAETTITSYEFNDA